MSYKIKYGENGEIECVSIPLKNSEIAFCKEVAQKCTATNQAQYRLRNQHDPEMIQLQIYYGKIAEVAVCRFLRSQGLQVSAPDFGIYSKEAKSWARDMVCIKDGVNYPIHSKCTTLESKRLYTLSWIVQFGGIGRGHTDKEIFQAKSGLMACCCPNEEDETVIDIFGFISVAELHEHHLLKMPGKNALKGTKRALYYCDVRVVEHNEEKNLRWNFVSPQIPITSSPEISI